MADAAGTTRGAVGSSRVVAVPTCVEELRLDLSRERVIRVVGRDRRGARVERLLRVTGKGKLLLV
jgi:hypothetical protein